jgi:hypothetical protein
MPRSPELRHRITIAMRAGELLRAASNERYHNKTATNPAAVYESIREFIRYRRLTPNQRRVWWWNIDAEARRELADMAPTEVQGVLW